MWRIQAFDRDGREIANLDVAGGEVTIGREADRRLVLPSPSVSRRHAKIVLDGPQPYVQDEGSANHIAQWVTTVVRKPCDDGGACASGEQCVGGVCKPILK